MKEVLFVALTFAASGVLGQTTWQHAAQDGQTQGQATEVFRLEGKYLTPPRAASSSEAPALVIECLHGRVEHNYLDFNAVLATREGSFPALMEARLDGNPTYIAADAISADGTSAYFARSALEKILHARQVVVGADEERGPEILVQFEIPAVDTIEAACGKERIPNELQSPVPGVRYGVMASNVPFVDLDGVKPGLSASIAMCGCSRGEERKIDSAVGSS